MTRWRWLVVNLLLLPSAFAQSAVLTGKVVDSEQAPVAAAKILILAEGRTQPTITNADASGSYRVEVPAGRYTLRAVTKGAAESKPQVIVIHSGDSISADLVLSNDPPANPQFFDKPEFTVAGLTDNTYRGGHGSDNVLRSSEDLAKATASLSSYGSGEEESDHALGVSNERTGHPLEAVREFQRAVELNPSERNLFDLGTELLSHLAPQAAEGVFTRGVTQFPRSVRMLLGQAVARYASGHYEQAGRSFFEATDVAPATDETPYLFLSKVKAPEIVRTADYEQRMARFEHLQPQNVEANYYYAVCLWNEHHSMDARALLEKAISLDPHYAPAYLQLGVIDVGNARYSEAVSAFQKAIQENPELEEAHYRLSEIYRITGNRKRARQELAIFVQLSTASAEKREHERRDIQQFVIALRQTDKSQ